MGFYLADLGSWMAGSCFYTTATGHGYAWSITAFWRDAALARPGAMVFGWGKYMSIRHFGQTAMFVHRRWGTALRWHILYRSQGDDVSD